MQQSATARISRHFASGKALTPLAALGVYGSYRLADVVHKLRKKGRGILTKLQKDANGKTYAEYKELKPGAKVRMARESGGMRIGEPGTFVSVVEGGHIKLKCAYGHPHVVDIDCVEWV